MAKKPMLKRSCNQCKASAQKQGYGYSCSLGYNVDKDLGIPKEACPKPTSYTMLVAIKHRLQVMTGRNGTDK